MEFIQKMILENKKECKQKIVNILDNLNKDNFINDFKNIAAAQIKEVGILHSFKIDIEIDYLFIFIYLDNNIELRYRYNNL